MKFGTFEQDRDYLTHKFRKQLCDPATGLDNETLKVRMMDLVDRLGEQPHPTLKARAFEFVTRNLRIDVSPHDWYVTFGCWDRHDRPLSPLAARWNAEVDAACSGETSRISRLLCETGANMYYKDFDHSVPDWEAILSLGFPGLRERARCYRRQCEWGGRLTAGAAAYFDGIEIAYSAILDMLARFRDYAIVRAGGSERVADVGECLEALLRGAPTNTYQALHLIYLYFVFGEHVDRMQVRSLGNLDRMLGPYYEQDLANGRFSDSDIREFVAYFLMQFASINNYWGHPFYLGGTKADGASEISELSYLILDVYDQLDIPTPKIQLKTAPNTPVKFLNKTFDMIRRGHNSLVFVCEPGMKRALMAMGYSEEEARTCDIKGCYEFSPRARYNETAGGHINMLKPLELVLNDGVDPLTGKRCGIQTGKLENLRTFSDFYQAYIRQLGGLIEKIIQCADVSEAHLAEINPALVLSATVTHSLETARDAFADGSVYNVTGILNAGLGTLVDALMAIKEFVYEKQVVALAELRDALGRNWTGHEKLRLKILRSPNKYGNGIAAVDFYADMISRYVANKINHRPNARGGYYVASMHSARTFITLGEKTGATPDGRLAGEEISKNVSPAMGVDVNGVTALITSVTTLEPALFQGDFAVDVMLHPATVQGDDGLAVMRILLDAYLGRNGIGIQFNIFDAEQLIEAQKHPEKYANLQVRVCGWNVRFTDISTQEQDQYIKRAMSLRQ